MTAPIRQHIPLPVGVDGVIGWRMSAGPDQDHARAAAAILTAKPRQAEVAVHGDVAVVRLRGELGASVLHSYLSGIWGRVRAGLVVDLAELAFIDCACLGVLVRHCKQVRGQGGSLALAGPQPAVRAVLAATGLLTWFEVHDTVTEAVADAGTRRSPVFAATASAQP